MSRAMRRLSSPSSPSGPSEPGTHGTPCDFMTRIAETLSPMVNGLGFGAYEYEAALLDPFGKVRILGEEAVAGVDRHRVGDLRGADDGRHVEVAARGGRRADAHGLVREQHVLEAVVGRRMHRHRLDTELPAGAQDPQRDLAAVGDDDLLDHGGSIRLRTTVDQTRPGRRFSP